MAQDPNSKTKPHLDARMRDLMTYQLRRASSEVLLSVSRLLEPFGLRRTTLSALSVISQNPGVSPSQLAQALSMERPNIVQIITQLESANFIVRKRAADDGRAYSLFATDHGAQQCEQALQQLDQFDASLRNGLSEAELTVLKKALERIEQSAKEGKFQDG